MYRKNNEQGFTLIELIVVIVLLGILAAIAVPRFINQTGNARIAALKGLQGAILSAQTLAQAEYKANGGTGTSITMDGTAVAVISGTGMPSASTGGIGAALSNYSGFTPDYTTTAGSAIFNFSTAVSNCNVTYTPANYTTTAGSTVLTSSGCTG